MDVKSRKLGCILASVVGDAAAQPLQWIYDVNKLNALLGDAEEIEFWSPSANPFYCIDTGKQSCYGDQAHAILKSLVRKKEFNLDDQKQSTYEMFGPGTEYALIDEALKKGYPVKAAWRNGCIKYFVKKMEEKSTKTGSPDDTQIDAVTKIPPIVAIFAGHSDLLFRAEESIRMAQDNDLSVAMGLAAARIIERCLLTTNTSESMLDVVKYVMKCLSANDRTNPQELDKTVVDYLQEVIDCKDLPHSEVVPKRFATSCDMPKAFLASVHGLIKASNYVEGMRSTIRVGGNHAGRCAFIGACFGAMYGDSIIPKTWQKKTLKYNDFLELSTKLVNDL